MKFKEFILNEQKQYLGQKVGDILAAAEELKGESGKMGSRDLSRFSERIVNQIRRVLHSYWSKENQVYLKDLQKIGVAIIKAVKEKGDLEKTVSGSADALNNLVKKIGSPINKIASPEGTEGIESASDSRGTSNTVKPVRDQYKPPQEKKDIEKDPMPGAPVNKDPQLTDQPSLAGQSGQQLSAM
jgi:hypothetical protein